MFILSDPSRRSDLEILGYCLLQWACGRLPWEDKLLDKDYVAREKIRYDLDYAYLTHCSLSLHWSRYKGDIRGLMSACFHDNPQPSCLYEYMKSVYRMDYTHKPDYTRLKDLFQRELKDLGCKDDHKQLDWITKPTVRKVSHVVVSSRLYVECC